MKGVGQSRKLVTTLASCLLHTNKWAIKLAAALIVVTTSLYHYSLVSPEGVSGAAETTAATAVATAAATAAAATAAAGGPITKYPTKKFIEQDDPTCSQLLTNGSFLPGEIWKPEGCSMHHYTPKGTQQCIKTAAANSTTTLMFLGNSRVRAMFNHFMGLVQAPKGKRSRQEDRFTRPNFRYQDKKIGLDAQYFWRELFNEDTVLDLMQRIKTHPPSMVVIETILHYMANYEIPDTDVALRDFEKGIKTFVKELDGLPFQFPVVFVIPQPIVMKNLLRKNDPRWRLDVFQQLIDIARRVLQSSHVAVCDSIHLIAKHRPFDYVDAMHVRDSTIHYYDQILTNFFCNRHQHDLKADTCCMRGEDSTIKTVRLGIDERFEAKENRTVLPSEDGGIGTDKNRPANATKNGGQEPEKNWTVPLAKDGGFVEGVNWTVASSSDRYNGILLAVVLLVVICFFAVQLKNSQPEQQDVHGDDKSSEHNSMLVHYPLAPNKSDSNIAIFSNNDTALNVKLDGEQGATASQKPGDDCKQIQAKLLHLCWCILKLVVILGYFILCDRVKLFKRDAKQFSLIGFLAPLGAALTMAIASSRSLVKTDSSGLMMHRDVTDEWKGWMQLVLLVYHVTGASKHVAIYMHARLIVSSYLFLTGYGHFTRFLKTGSSGGMSRYCQMMFRLNFLTMLLCLVMDQPYMNYYFVPLVSFWFTVLHLVLSLPPWNDGRASDNPRLSLCCGAVRISLLTALVVVFSYSEAAFKTVFGSWPLQSLFQLADDGVREWSFRWRLDRFSTLYGMMFAWVCHAINSAYGTSSAKVVSTATTVLTGLTSLAGLSSYSYLLHFCDGKVSCNAWHPYFAWLPIISFVLFRHHNSLYRSTFSPWLAWLGRISLELFVAQYHLFLANNTHAVLVLVPGHSLVNLLVLGLVLVCVADELHQVTAELQRTWLPDNVKRPVGAGIFMTLVVLCVLYN